MNTSTSPEAIDLSHFDRDDNAVSLRRVQRPVPSNIKSPNSGGTAHILPAERARASFNVAKMTNVLDGSAKQTARRRFIISPTDGKEMFDKYFWNRHDQLKEHVRFFLEAHEEFVGKIVPNREDGSYMTDNSMMSGSFINHFGLFLPTLLGQGSAEQQSWWVPRAINFKMIGVYAQTELGHGSNVRGLTTVAHYDKTTQEFVLNTPTLQSIKWWVSGLGKVATHALVYAQLILDGKEYGVHIFMVQLRDVNHRPLPGIEVGDVGPKLGDDPNDTGFLRLDNVRVPREHMLSRWQHVTVEGEYVRSERKTNPKVHYATMVFARGGMIKGAGGYLARSVTIAVRYSCVRHQGFVNTKDTPSYAAEERPVIDYRVQRYRLFKQLALAYAIRFIGNWMLTQFSDFDHLNDLSSLPEIAATAAGLKGLTTFLAAQGMEDLRKCCGGHGYLLASGVAAHAVDYVWQTTAEGDYVVMLLQCARFLIKSLQAARAGKPTPGPCSYLSVLHGSTAADLSDLSRFAPPPVDRVELIAQPAYLLSLYRYRSLVAVASVGVELDRRFAQGAEFDTAWNDCALELVNAVRSHCLTFMLEVFHQQAENIEDAPCKTACLRLCSLYAISNILDDQWDGLVSHGQLQLMRTAARQLCDELRPDAVALVDAFDIPDRVLQSALGRSDGNVYEALYEAALKSELNQRDPFDGYKQYLSRWLDKDLLSAPNQLLPEAKL